MKKLLVMMMIVLGVSAYANREEASEFEAREKIVEDTQKEYIEKMSRGNQSQKELDLSVDEVIKQNMERSLRGSGKD